MSESRPILSRGLKERLIILAVVGAVMFGLERMGCTEYGAKQLKEAREGRAVAPAGGN